MARASLGTVTTSLLDVELAPLGAEARPLEDWLTTFPLLPVLLDPYTNESAWILHTARQILVAYAEAGCRGCWVVTCGADDAGRFLGPYAQEILTFADPDGACPPPSDWTPCPRSRSCSQTDRSLQPPRAGTPWSGGPSRRPSRSSQNGSAQ